MSVAVQRGDVVIVDFTPTNPAARVRSVLVIQDDRDNARMQMPIVAQITSNLSCVQEDTQLLLDPTHPDWAASDLHLPSAINGCLKAALELS